MKYFVGVKNLKDLHRKLVKLAQKHHPDKGGSEEIMKAINIEYSELEEKLRREGKIEESALKEIDFAGFKFAANEKFEQIKLREYQIKFLNDILEKFAEGHTSICGVAPCGAGKTIMTGSLIKKFYDAGKRVIFFVHRQELIEQTSKAFTALGIEHGIISAGRKIKVSQEDRNKPDYKLVQIASVQTLVRRINSIPEPDLLVCDECHHILANSYKKIIEHW